MSAPSMAAQLGIQRESLYRLEREPGRRMSVDKQIAYAAALGIAPEELWRPPGQLSLDGLLKDASEELRGMAADIVRRLVRL